MGIKEVVNELEQHYKMRVDIGLSGEPEQTSKSDRHTPMIMNNPQLSTTKRSDEISNPKWVGATVILG